MPVMWTKICGITTSNDAAAVVAAGGSAIGLNFYAGSSRCISPQQAHVIAAEVHNRVDVVGVFVNSRPADVRDVVQRVGLTAVQFHGDESDSVLQEFHQYCPQINMIRAIRIDQATLTARLDELAQTIGKVPLSAILLDAHVPGEYGGTGQRPDADVVKAVQSLRGLPRLILAGGLTADNVAVAVQNISPWGVDTASGVERAPGMKDHQLVSRFVRQAVGGTPGCTRL
jgi:phosphoribosylanthranilate isomerase